MMIYIQIQSTEADTPQEPDVPVKNVEDFVPDVGDLDDSFLDDTKDVKDIVRGSSKEPNSDRLLFKLLLLYN